MLHRLSETLVSQYALVKCQHKLCGFLSGCEKRISATIHSIVGEFRRYLNPQKLPIKKLEFTHHNFGVAIILWMDKILHHIETMGNHFLLVFTGEPSFQGLLGGQYNAKLDLWLGPGEFFVSGSRYTRRWPERARNDRLPLQIPTKSCGLGIKPWSRGCPLKPTRNPKKPNQKKSE